MGEPFVVIGGDAAGMSAASKAKRDNPDLEIIAFEQGDWVSYAACGMPYYIKGEVESLDDLVQVTAEEFRDERNIDLRTNHEVVGIDPEANMVVVETGENRFEQEYDTLLIATGARPVEPPINGLDLDGVFTIHNMDEADAIQQFIQDKAPGSAVIVGGGYIGVEMAEALAAHNIDINVFEMLPHILQPFGESVASVVESHLQDQRVTLDLNTAVERLIGDSQVTGVELAERTVETDMVIIGVGVKPNVEIAEQAGIELGETGAIITDEYGRTNYESIFAAGDCAEMTHTVTGEADHVPLALTANRAGRAIGQTVAGKQTEIGETAGTAIVKAFDFGAARTGVIDEDIARDAGFDPIAVEITAPSKAHYYPGSTDLTVTLVGDRNTGRVLGGSIVGNDGVKRIDTVATALHMEAKVSELEYFDLAYAPPFSPTWDPILTAARVLNGKLDSE